jgi:hypothetical protein
MDDILNLTPKEKQEVEEKIGPLKTVTEFCSSVIEATKEIPFRDKLVELLPWAAKGGKLVGEITPLAKVLVKLVDDIVKEKDPEVLGILACTLAYERSAALAVAIQGQPRNHVPLQNSIESAKQDLKRLNVAVDLTGFSLETPLAHPFVWQADDSFYTVVRAVGYADNEWRQIQRQIHDKFRADLVEVLSHGETAARFEPFTKRLLLGDNAAAYAALNSHIERQRWLFEDRPVLNVEPFTLADVYVDTECGKLLWKDFPDPSQPKPERTVEKFDPFSEKFGGRHPLLETVFDYLRDPKFNDAIVIQGAAGCGKSSFTLRLANALRREGLRPLRVRLKFLDLKKNLSEALAQVVLQPEEGESSDLGQAPRCSDPFLQDSIFQEKTKFGSAEICPYVLILDGWDEISVAVNEGFEIEVHRMLKNVRDEFLRPRNPRIRVILTGRPSAAVEKSQFLRDGTPVLTLREYTPDQLETYVKRVKDFLDKIAPASGAVDWDKTDWNNVDRIVESYRKDGSKLDILGLPLLAHLSLRLMAEWRAGSEQLLSDRTTLYRHLLDVTCLKAGKAPEDPDDLLGQARIRGRELRKMLQQTAVAISANGQESISFRELQLRLKKNRKQTMEEAENSAKDRPLTSLMISFYFKGGREHLGCEFLHKSFREYLQAEAIVESLKAYGNKCPGNLPKREPYWRDFQESDPRRQFSRDLGQLLCPYPISAEIRSHLENLLKWEIQRSVEAEANQHGQVLDPISLEHWRFVREGLSDLWDWWGEGVHLRPQPLRDDSDNLQYRPAFVNELLDYSLPRDRSPDAPEWWPGRLVNGDANLGDALCQLNAWVHGFILQVEGWNQISYDELEEIENAERWPYQSRFRYSGKEFIRFCPAGTGNYFFHYCNRINAAGNRRPSSFPEGINFAYTDLSGAYLGRLSLDQADLGNADLSDANLSLAFLCRCNFRGADLRRSFLHSSYLAESNLSESDCTGADFTGTSMAAADFTGAILREADLARADLHSANLTDANLKLAKNLTNEQLDSAVGDFDRQGLLKLTESSDD